jgi:hypothetical protein
MGQNESRVEAAVPLSTEGGEGGSSVKISPALIAQINRDPNDNVSNEKLQMAYEKGVTDMREHIEDNRQVVCAYDLVQEQAELLTREEEERRYIRHMQRAVTREHQQIRQDMPCMTEQKAALKCYQQKQSDLLDCSPIIDAYLHCTSKGKQ